MDDIRLSIDTAALALRFELDPPVSTKPLPSFSPERLSTSVFPFELESTKPPFPTVVLPIAPLNRRTFEDEPLSR